MQQFPFDEPDYLFPFKVALERFVNGRPIAGDKALLVDLVQLDEEAKRLYLEAKKEAGKEDLRLPGETENGTWAVKKKEKHVFKPQISKTSFRPAIDAADPAKLAKLQKERSKFEKRLHKKRKKKGHRPLKPLNSDNDEPTFPWHYVIPITGAMVLSGLSVVALFLYLGASSRPEAIDISDQFVHLNPELIEVEPIFVEQLELDQTFRVPNEWLEGSLFAQSIDKLLKEKAPDEGMLGLDEADLFEEDESPELFKELQSEELLTELRRPWGDLVEFEDYIEIHPEIEESLN